MIAVADENIPFAREAFAAFGEVRTLPGREIVRAALSDADLLLVRSITRVDAALLEGTPVRFVGTATIGEDHVDADWLRDRGIGFASAPGCNANSVAEYVTAALLALAERQGRDLAGASLGIVGVGNAGSRVDAKARALGMRTVWHDPPRAEAEGAACFAPREAMFACDFVSLHVPLTRTGPHPTHHMVDAAFLEAMKPSAILINTARGAVVDGSALASALASGKIAGAALDVWENEPRIDPALLDCAAIATPHIAGYSYDGKVRGTEMIRAAACRHFGLPEAWRAAPHLPPPEVPEIRIPADESRPIARAVRAVYDIMRDDAALRAAGALPSPGERAEAFDRLRKHYPRRREFPHTRVLLDAPAKALRDALARLGFRTGAGCDAAPGG